MKTVFKTIATLVMAGALSAGMLAFAACGEDSSEDSSANNQSSSANSESGNNALDDIYLEAEDDNEVSDVVTEEQWIAAFSIENFANVSVDRSYYRDYKNSCNAYGDFSDEYYDESQSFEEETKYLATSSAKLDLDYSEYEYSTTRGTEYFDVFNGNVSMESDYTYGSTLNYNYTDVEVLKEVLGEDYFDWDAYVEYRSDVNETEIDNYLINDYILLEETNNEAYPYYDHYNSYIAEQRTVNGTAGDFVYSNSNYCDPEYIAIGSHIGYLSNPLYISSVGHLSFLYLGDSYYFNQFTYDYESGAYVFTYEVDVYNVYSDLDTLGSLDYQGYEWALDGGATAKYYVKIKDGHISSIKIVQNTASYFSYTTNGYYYENTEATEINYFKYYDYGTTSVTIPDEISAELAKLKEES